MKPFSISGYIPVNQVIAGNKTATVNTSNFTDIIKEEFERRKLPVPDEVLFPELLVLKSHGPQEKLSGILDIIVYIRIKDEAFVYKTAFINDKVNVAKIPLQGLRVTSPNDFEYTIAVVDPQAEKMFETPPKVRYLITGYAESQISTTGKIF